MPIFKAYDIRGVYPEEINEENILPIGRAFAHFLGGGSVGVGRDMRSSSPGLARSFIQGLRQGGADVVDLGLSSTPMLYFAVGHLGLAGGANVTASHNPSQYNGLKLCREKSIPVGSDSGLMEIEAMASRGEGTAEKEGGYEEVSVLDAYHEHLLGFPKLHRPLKVVLDGANGMVGPTLERILPTLPGKFVTMYMEPDGTFPNHEANPIKVQNLADVSARVRAEGADMGAGFDGDADRVAFVDEKGAMIPGDITTALLARTILKETGPSAVVYDLRSSLAVEEEILAAGGRPVRDRVGHSFIKATMRREDAVFGGELSGHYYFRENFTADNAEIALFQMMNLLSASDLPLSEIVAPIYRYAVSGEINFEVQDKDAMIAELGRRFPEGEQDFLDGITIRFDTWWFNVRKSNTEPILRLNLEGRTPESMKKGLDRLYDVLGKPSV